MKEKVSSWKFERKKVREVSEREKMTKIDVASFFSREFRVHTYDTNTRARGENKKRE